MAQQLQVLLGHGWQRVRGPGDIEPLARGDGAADLDLGVDLALLDAHSAHTQTHAAIRQVEDLLGRQCRGEPGPGDRHVAGVADLLLAAAERD